MRVINLPAALLILLALVGCGDMEKSMRDMNRSLYRSMGGETVRVPRGSAGDGPLVACFNAETGLLYMSQTGRCAPGYANMDAAQAEPKLTLSQPDTRDAQRAANTPRQQQPAPSAGVVASAPPATPSATPSQGSFNADAIRAPGQALCYNDRTQQLFGADQCPPDSRWVNSEEAESLQRAALEVALWCYYPGRKLLYRSRACRPGDQALTVADADRVWSELAPDRRPRQRPAEARGSGLAPVPPAQAAPRSGIDSTPLPAPR